MTCEQRRDLLLLYVSDALEADEKQDLRRHLTSGCPQCAGYLAEAEATFNSIPQALEPVLPPPGLKQRLMDRIDAAEMNKPAGIAGSELTPDSFPIRLFKMFVPAAVAAGIAIVATHAYVNQNVQKLTMEARDSRRDATASKMLLASLQEEFQSQTQVVEMLRSPDVKVVHLKPTDLQPAAIANVVWDQKDRRWLFLATGLKPAVSGQTYELWIIPKGGSPLPAGTFDVDPKGRATVAVDLPKEIGESNTAAVSNEKLGGEQSPKGQIQIVGAVD